MYVGGVVDKAHVFKVREQEIEAHRCTLGDVDDQSNWSILNSKRGDRMEVLHDSDSRMSSLYASPVLLTLLSVALRY